ncbi:CHAD domain-containing protein [Sphaerospermopsis torques-reginae]|uniref:CHAD domain-containing protein n=1 Tax=Sphaerospermopsis torques-reginae ITEP-024 TaxID=984208 RepID=A0ABX8X411_9CYAN|nr:CHAD domain-containing protein [Sphaerospermopsis torques-reginae]QYX33417.1 CHAD domain-containing protein [Sphaerospermopsis torques-reginae ITEP-024]
MNLATTPTVKSLGDCAYQAIEKHFHKTIKWEKSVKKDEDTEALHQMRVGMRRLRTAVSRFELCLNLPKSASDQNIGKIARILGNLRDLDVLKEILENHYKPHLLPKEQASLEIAFSTLAKQREVAFSQVQKILKDETYKSLKNHLHQWLEKPSYHPLASLPIHQVLPDLLLPEVSKLLLHPGWMIGTQVVNSEVVVQSNWTPEELEKNLKNQGKILHDLRKQAKRVRYQMELFTDLYGEAFSTHISQVKSIQEILGMLQDSIVLNEWLENIFKSEINEQISGLITLLAANRYQLWQQWQPLQEQYLKVETRQNLYLTILPSLSIDN